MIDVEDVPTRPVPAVRAQADQRMLWELAASVTSPARPGRRRLIVVGALSAVVLTGATAATAYTLLSPQAATDRGSARCYARVSDDTGSGFPGTTIEVASSAGRPRPDVSPLAIEICADLWRRGFLTPRGSKHPTLGA